MNTCYIFGAAPIDDYRFIHLALDDSDAVICADGGYHHALACGLQPDWVVGDFDSESAEVLLPNTIRVKPEKDDTDMELAVAQGISLRYRTFVLYGALGGRLDHTVANLQLLASLTERGIQATLLDAQNEVTMLQNGTRTLTPNEYPYVSIFSHSSQSEGVTLTGFRYPLTEKTLSDTTGGRTVSNALAAPTASITVRRGMLLILRTKDH